MDGCLLLSGRVMNSDKNRWNLVIITADDLNADSVGWMGSNVGATPNMDAFAATCHQLRNCHTVIPVCQPSRAALMTGRLPHRNGALGFGPIRDDVTTLTEVMSRSGYFTAAINKIHHMMPPGKFQWDRSLEGSGKNPAALRAQFEQCLRAAAEQNKPFFINANSTDPHGPFPGKDTARSRNMDAAPVKLFSEAEIVVPSFLEDLPTVREEVARYFSAVRRLDQTFGELLAALRTAARLDDTVVAFVSDHGMAMPFAKATLYRNATWTPVLLRWPGMGTPLVNTDVRSNIDIMPTLLELLGLTIPSGLDGRSWVPLLTKEEQSNGGHVFTQIDSIHSGKRFPARCVRTKTRAYIWNAWVDGKTQFRAAVMSTRSSWKAMLEAAGNDPKLQARIDQLIYRSAEEFYDEEKDRDERNNLIADSQYQSEIAQLKELLLAHMEKTADPLAQQFRRVQGGAPKRLFSRWRNRGAKRRAGQHI
jgi:N-sulfoglucosamine sulfohydrolase